MNKSAALKQIEDLIIATGYDSSSIIKDFRFVDKYGEIRSADFVVFGDPYCFDLSTSCLSVGWAKNNTVMDELADFYASLATPIILISSSDCINVYDNRIQPLHKTVLTYAFLEKHFSTNRLNYSQSNLLSAKRSPYIQQLTLWAIEATKERLVSLFEHSILSEQLRLTSVDNAKLIKTALNVLAACIVEDKLWGSAAPSSNAIDLLNKCVQKFPHYFQGILGDPIAEEISTRIYNIIRNQLSFRLLTNNMLGYFYEYAILDDDLRDSLGIHWTDESIAHRICASLPFESLYPDNRCVLDGTCGSGSLLVAACQRMSSLLPNSLSGQEKHDWLTDKVLGVEIEKFSCEVAKLSLLLYSLPYGNRWRVINSDFLETPIHPRPNIIVGNPPFKESKTDERALRFVDKYLDLLEPEGIIGIVLPETYLESKKCMNSRKNLLDNTKIFEVWHLPEGTFRTSSIATTILLAKKNNNNKNSRSAPVKIVEIDKADIDNFRQYGEPSRTYLVDYKNWATSTDFRIVSSVLDPILSALDYENVLGNIATLSEGIKPGNDSVFGIEPLEEYNNSHCVKWLQSPGNNILQPYGVCWKDYRNKHRLFTLYPHGHARHRPGVPFDKSKILINSVRNAAGRWRIYGAIDHDSFYVSQSFWVLYNVKQPFSLEEVVAVINNPLASAIINKLNRRSYMTKDNLLSIPIPLFKDEQKLAIKQLVNKIGSIKRLRSSGWEEQARSLCLKIDEIVFKAFNLSNKKIKILTDFMQNKYRPGEEWEVLPPSSIPKTEYYANGKTWKVIGCIDSLNIKNNQITVSIYEYDPAQKISLPKRIPGWLLEPGQAFEADIPFEQRYETDLSRINFLSFRPLPLGYLTDTDLNERLNEHL